MALSERHARASAEGALSSEHFKLICSRTMRCAEVGTSRWLVREYPWRVRLLELLSAPRAKLSPSPSSSLPERLRQHHPKPLVDIPRRRRPDRSIPRPNIFLETHHPRSPAIIVIRFALIAPPVTPLPHIPTEIVQP